MARVHNRFSMEAPPEQAQEMFVRDLVPDLHRDGRFTVYKEAPGELRLSDADFALEPAPEGRGRSLASDLAELADPDEFEAHEEEAAEPALADVLRRGTDAEAVTARGGHGARSLGLLASHRLKVTFEPDGGSATRVTIKGSAGHDVARGLERLGTPRHWPEIAELPHD